MRQTNQNHYLFQRRGVFYFSRRVPGDLKSHYDRPRITFSLRTKSRKAAQARAASLATRLEEDWLTLRWRSKDDPLKRFLREPGTVEVFDSPAPLLSEAKDLYIRSKSAGRSVTFMQAAERAARYLIEVSGDKPIDGYTRAEVNALRDAMLERGLIRATVQRSLSVLRAIVNFATREHGLEDVRVFSGVYLGEDRIDGTRKRKTIPPDALQAVQATCRHIDDEARWLIGLISDTGMRLSEAAGLIKDDLILDDEHPHIVLKPHPWRRLKTEGSERIVPLVGTALWAAKRAQEESSRRFLFPRYCDETQCKANSASAALNKWLAPRVPDGCVIHSFRHSLRDRLRAVECPPDIIDRLGGWSIAGVGEGYGDGYPISVLHKWMVQIE